jgi:signal transduction histidine kinase
MVERNVDRIRSQVLNILYYAKEREPAWACVEAGAVLAEVREVVAPRAAEHQIALALEVDPSAGALEADPAHLRAMLVNLAENSVDACRVDKKKTDHRVTLSARGDAGRVLFDVADDGIGMDRETRERAFTLFFSSKGSEGTGLGLFVANKIVRAHHGRIRIESELERGTRFVVEIPRRPPEAQATTGSSGGG